MCKRIILTISLCFVSTFSYSSGLLSEWKANKSSEYLAYNNNDLIQFEKIFREVLSGNLNNKLISNLKKLNFQLLEKKDYFILSELAPRMHGAGIYIINKSSENNVLIQAPHAYYDRNTVNIAIKIVQENDIKALSINTVHRNLADMAHIKDTVFVAFSRVFSNVFFKNKIIQLHGFNESKRLETYSVDFILSNGTASHYQNLTRQSECLSRKLRSLVKVYPLNISVLGGTTNSTGRMLRSNGVSGFEHIEIGSKMRQSLKRSSTKRNLFSQCILR